MIKSMTGYGKADHLLDHGKISVEMRSVNHRYGEISVKLPRSLICFENEVRKAIAARLKRGKIDVFIQLETLADERLPAINIPLARAYYAAFAALRDELGCTDPIPLTLITSQKDVLAASEGDLDVEQLRGPLFSAVEVAVTAMDAMRSREGCELADDLQRRRETLSTLVDGIAARAALVPVEYAERLTDRLAQFAGETILDSARVAQEVVLLADKSDITEELVRFGSHLAQFDAAFHVDEPVGRKLDFLLQELGREVNTIGSKANDAEITTGVVALKAELEKIREQVQNIE
jgi:uncharacterized protein (TIGR00255 family)